MRMRVVEVILITLFVLSVVPAGARDQIHIVGSSTVFPYTQAVAEQYSNLTGAPSPIVESTGTGGGIKLFCSGIGERYPDLTGASRAMTQSELSLCRKNGVSDITEALIGFDGVTIAVSRAGKHSWDLALHEIFLALASQVPFAGRMVDNPNQLWSDVNPELPDQAILVYGPPPTSGTRDAFVDLVMHAGCRSLSFVLEKGLDSDGEWIKENCSRMRQDGPYVEAGENDNLIVQRLIADSEALGIFGYSFLFENRDILDAVSIDGVLPDEETIGDKSYPISRPLYFYTKNAHRGVIPHLQEFIEEYVSEDALSPYGYLAERGLIALTDEQLAKLQDDVIGGATLEIK